MSTVKFMLKGKVTIQGTEKAAPEQNNQGKIPSRYNSKWDFTVALQ